MDGPGEPGPMGSNPSGSANCIDLVVFIGSSAPVSSSADDKFRRALASLQAGNASDAEPLLKKLLAAQPRHVGGLNLLGIVLTQLGRFEEAERYLRRALNENATSDATFFNYGMVLKALRRPAEALQPFTRALALNGAVAETWNFRGTVLNDLGRHDEAIADFDKAISQRSNYPEAFFNKGRSLAALRFYDQSLSAFEQALSLKPDLAEAWYARGNVLAELERSVEALGAYDKAVATKPDFAEAWLGRGNILTALKQYNDAFAAYDKALQLGPGLAHAWLGRGNVFAELKMHSDALAVYDKALTLAPELAEAWLGRGNVFFDQRRGEEALAAYDKAVALKPDLAGAWFARGDTFDSLNRAEDALASYDKAIELNADFADAYFGKSLVQLSLGQFQEGWPLYEWRAKRSEFDLSHEAIEARGVSIRNSQSQIAGKNVAVIGEQGVGDQIMFASMLPDLVRDARSIAYQVDTRLMAIFSRNFPTVNFVSVARPEEILSQNFDSTMRAGSLGYLYRRTAASFPRAPYLKADPGTVDRWRSLIGGDDGIFKIGISWRGGTAKTGSERRSFALDELAPLLMRDDCQFISLQYGDVGDEIEKYNNSARRKITYFPEDNIDDFDDLAGLIAALDLVVSVQNATVHLSGALGKKCLAMLPWKAEWRYGRSGSQMIWYSSVELFRQSASGNWSDVLSAVNSRLSGEIAKAP